MTVIPPRSQPRDPAGGDPVLAQGTLTTTSLSYDAERGEPVVIKALNRPPPATAAAGADFGAAIERRFQMVGRLLTTLDHPNIVRVHRCERRAEGAAWVMEQVSGRPLAAIAGAAAPRPTPDRIRALLDQLLDALAALHDAGLIHRDIKPANILVRDDGQPVLIDFDAAAVIGTNTGDADSSLTPGFGAPEQYHDNGIEGPWTDLYGLGAVGWWLVTGRTPPDAPSRLRDDTLVPAAALAGDAASRRLFATIDAALSLDPRDRPASARAWRATLGDIAADVRPQPAEPVRPPAAGEGVAGAEAAAAIDPVPPTVRLRRRPRYTAPAAAADPAAPPLRATGPAAPPSASAGGAGTGRWGVAVTAVLAIAASIGAGVAGWDYYLTEVKRVWTVDAGGGGDVETIAAAFAKARDGAVVRVRPGTYREAVIMDRSRDLQGDGPAEAVVIAPPPGQACVDAGAPAGAIRRLTLEGAGPAAPGEAAPACVTATAGALVVEAVRIAAAAGPGLSVTGTAVAVATGNHIDGAGPAVLVDGAARAELSGNSIATTAHSAVVIRAGADAVVSNNQIDGAGAAGVLVIAARARIDGNRIAAAGRSGLEIRDGATAEVTGNTLAGAGEAGVFIHRDGQATITANTISGSGLSGIVVAAGTAEITGNRIEGNGEHGVFLLAGASGRVADNTISGNQGHGIATADTSPASLGDNSASGNREPQVNTGEVVLRQRPGAPAGADPAGDSSDTVPPAGPAD